MSRVQSLGGAAFIANGFSHGWETRDRHPEVLRLAALDFQVREGTVPEGKRGQDGLQARPRADILSTWSSHSLGIKDTGECILAKDS